MTYEELILNNHGFSTSQKQKFYNEGGKIIDEKPHNKLGQFVDNDMIPYQNKGIVGKPSQDKWMDEWIEKEKRLNNPNQSLNKSSKFSQRDVIVIIAIAAIGVLIYKTV